MPRDHHFAFAKTALPQHCFKSPDQVFRELRGPMREAFLMFLWTEVGKTVPLALPHVDIGSRTPGGPEEVIALNVVGADVRNGVEVVVVQMPPAIEANEAFFIALTRGGGMVRVFTYERSADGSAVLAEIEQNGRKNFGFFDDTSLPGFLSALSNVTQLPLQGLPVPTSSPMDVVRGQPQVGPRPPAKKTVWPPLLLTGLFVLPAFFTFMFALGDAQSFGDDWVKISVPLMLITGFCVAWFFSRLMGKAGWAVGAVGVSVVFSGAFVMLGGKVKERQAFRKNYEEMETLRGFCEGKGDANSRALPYEADGGGPYPTIVYQKSNYGSLGEAYDPEFKAWAPEPRNMRHVALVACVRETSRVIETCQYDMGASLDRTVATLNIEVFSIESGKKVHETTLQGGQPRACGYSEKFYGTSRKSVASGPSPTPTEIRDALKPIVDP